MRCVSGDPQPCYTALLEKVDIRELLHPQNRLTLMAKDLDAAFGKQIQHAAWYKHTGRDATEYLMVCISGTAFFFTGGTYRDMLTSDVTKAAHRAYCPTGEDAATYGIDESHSFLKQGILKDREFVPCQTHGPELIAFVRSHLRKTPIPEDKMTRFTVNLWRGPHPCKPDDSLCVIL